MTQNFNFDVNIEKRMPDTGKVFMVDRMTSDYAQAHPFDVDGFIESVHQKYEQMDTEDPQHFGNIVYGREQLRRLWNLVLQMPDRGDKSLYPNQHGPQPALMEVWHKAGDFWRRGLRPGDTLPAIVPACKITRLEDGGWIALFPKDIHLLEERPDNLNIGLDNEVDSFDRASADAHLPKTESEQKDAPVELDLFTQMQMEMQALREENERLKQCNMIQMRTAVRAARNDFDTENCPCETQGQPSPTRRQRRERRREQDVMALHTSPAITVDHTMEDDHSERNKKIFAAVATAVVFVVLANTVGLFGIAALGLLAGGLIK